MCLINNCLNVILNDSVHLKFRLFYLKIRIGFKVVYDNIMTYYYVIPEIMNFSEIIKIS